MLRNKALKTWHTPVIMAGDFPCRSWLILVLSSILLTSMPTDTMGAEAKRELTGKDGAPMVLVPAGAFLYGDGDEHLNFDTGERVKEPLQRLELPAFYMDTFEVTTERYGIFLRATGRAAPGRWEEISFVSDANRPVITVSWHDADAYCRHFGKRLPTEQEWEKAARGPDGRRYPWGNKKPTRQYANFGRDGKWEGYTTTLSMVGNHPDDKSPYGIYDMAGNVWEWTNSTKNGTDDRIVKGGTWISQPVLSQVYSQNWFPPHEQSSLIGFRCAQDAS